MIIKIKDKQIGIKEIAIVFLPAIALIMGYFAYEKHFSDKQLTHNNNYVEALPLPETKDTVKISSLKSDIYRDYDLRKYEEERKKNNPYYNVDIFGDEIKKEKSENEEIQNEDIFSKKTSTISQPVPVFNYGSSSNQKNSSGTTSNQKTVKDDRPLYVQKYEPLKNEETQQNNDIQTSSEAPRRRTNTSSSTSSNNSSSPLEIKAVIDNSNRDVKAGSTVRIRITENCNVSGVDIPKNTIISGIANFGNERVQIKVTSINYNGHILPVSLSAFEMDGIEGIYVPGGINQEIKEDAARSGAGSVNKGVTIAVPMVGSISTGAINKKVQDPSVKISDGHKIILKKGKVHN
ncbi:MAG: conjugative transposon protein TraM [Bacteroidia bacterium]